MPFLPLPPLEGDMHSDIQNLAKKIQVLIVLELNSPKKSLPVDSFPKKTLITKLEEGFSNCKIGFILRKEDTFLSFH